MLGASGIWGKEPIDQDTDCILPEPFDVQVIIRTSYPGQAPV